MSTITAESKHADRWSRLEPRHLQQPAALVFNPNAGHKLGVDTNSSGPDEVRAELKSEGIAFDAWPKEHAGHATDLARQAVAEGRELVIRTLGVRARGGTIALWQVIAAMEAGTVLDSSLLYWLAVVDGVRSSATGPSSACTTAVARSLFSLEALDGGAGAADSSSEEAHMKFILGGVEPVPSARSRQLTGTSTPANEGCRRPGDEHNGPPEHQALNARRLARGAHTRSDGRLQGRMIMVCEPGTRARSGCE